MGSFNEECFYTVSVRVVGDKMSAVEDLKCEEDKTDVRTFVVFFCLK